MLPKNLQKIKTKYSGINLHDILICCAAVLIKEYYHSYEFEDVKHVLFNFSKISLEKQDILKFKCTLPRRNSW
jgi:hypothetical protein